MPETKSNWIRCEIRRCNRRALACAADPSYVYAQRGAELPFSRWSEHGKRANCVGIRSHLAYAWHQNSRMNGHGGKFKDTTRAPAGLFQKRDQKWLGSSSKHMFGRKSPRRRHDDEKTQRKEVETHPRCKGIEQRGDSANDKNAIAHTTTPSG